eukprot:TRINITY_DN3962_c0_g1_i3.p1 TRINITY_DN3962_c0_g1~~TRINITY_DN3962_c0_g1_i3.p1  ORF type:complete len:987 (+),score=200.30 TRINITY_DN3962_c0_g1_i3:63-3023(+)
MSSSPTIELQPQSTTDLGAVFDASNAVLAEGTVVGAADDDNGAGVIDLSANNSVDADFDLSNQNQERKLTANTHIYVGERSVADLQVCAKIDTYQLQLPVSTVLIQATEDEIKIDTRPRSSKMMLFVRIFYAYNIFMSFLIILALSFKAILQVIYGFMIPTIRTEGDSSLAVFVSLYTIAVVLYLAITLQVSSWYMFLDTFMDFAYFLGDYNPNHKMTPWRSFFQYLLHLGLFLVPAMTFICVTLAEDIVEGYVFAHYVSIPSSLFVFAIFFIRQIYRRCASTFMVHEKIMKQTQKNLYEYLWDCAKRYVYYMIYPEAPSDENIQIVNDGWFLSYILNAADLDSDYTKTESLRKFNLLKEDIWFHAFVICGLFVCPLIVFIIVPFTAEHLDNGGLIAAMFFFFFATMAYTSFIYMRLQGKELRVLKVTILLAKVLVWAGLTCIMWTYSWKIGVAMTVVLAILALGHFLVQLMKRKKRLLLKKKYNKLMAYLATFALTALVILAIVVSSICAGWGLLIFFLTLLVLFFKFLSIIPHEPSDPRMQTRDMEPSRKPNQSTLSWILDLFYFHVDPDADNQTNESYGSVGRLYADKSRPSLYSHELGDDKAKAVQEPHTNYLKRIFRSDREVPLPTSRPGKSSLRFSYEIVMELLRSEEARRGLISTWIVFLIIAALMTLMAGAQLGNNTSSFGAAAEGCYRFPVRQAAPLINYAFCDNRFKGLTVLDYAYLAKAAYLEKENVDDALQSWTRGQFFVEKYPSEGSNEVYYYDFYDRANNFSVIAVRGTTQPFDWVQDADLWIEASLFQGIRVVVPFLYLWPQKIIELFILGLSKLDEVLTANEDDYDVRRYYLDVNDYIAEIKKQRQFVVVTGHSLGGGIAQITGVNNKIEAVAFSGPGIVLSRRKFGELSLEDINSYAFNIVPQQDIVPKVDLQGVLAQGIRCDLGVVNCHFMLNTICEIASVCGDPRGRGIRGEGEFCREFMQKEGCDT